MNGIIKIPNEKCEIKIFYGKKRYPIWTCRMKGLNVLLRIKKETKIIKSKPDQGFNIGIVRETPISEHTEIEMHGHMTQITQRRLRNEEFPITIRTELIKNGVRIV